LAPGCAGARSRGGAKGSASPALVCLTNLISPIVWKSYWVQAIPVFFVLLATAIAERAGARVRGLEILLLLLYFVGLRRCSPATSSARTVRSCCESLYVVTDLRPRALGLDVRLPALA
jgi:hypothetical protein